jgi:hypothetical protein
MIKLSWWAGLIVIVAGLQSFVIRFLSDKWRKNLPVIVNGIIVAIVGLLLTTKWLPLGAQKPFVTNIMFVLLFVGGFLIFFRAYEKYYPSMLTWILARKALFFFLLY